MVCLERLSLEDSLFFCEKMSRWSQKCPIGVAFLFVLWYYFIVIDY